MRRFPARDRRWRDWLPEEASSGAVPFQEANRSRLANRRMSPTSASSRAAPEGPMPRRSITRTRAREGRDCELGNRADCGR